MATNYRISVVSSALSHVGVVGGKKPGDDKFILYYNNIADTTFDVDTTPWCAIFVTYILRTSGVPTSICPNFAGCTALRDSFLIPNNIWRLRTSGYIPQPGDLIMFNWNKDMTKVQHVGFVEKVSGSLVYTVEGNSKGGHSEYGVRHKSYPLTSAYIVGYGALRYDTSSVTDTVISSMNTPTAPTTNNSTTPAVVNKYMLSSSDTKCYITKFQMRLRAYHNQMITVDGIWGPQTQEAAIKALQTCLNRYYRKNLTVDGKFGPKTKAACITVKLGAKGDFTYLAQGLLYAHGYNAGGFDGKFGSKFNAAIKQYQKDVNIRTILNAGKVDATTWQYLCTKW